MSRFIKLRRQVPERVIHPIQGYRMRVEVIDAGDMPAEIFVYQRLMAGSDAFDQFCNIACPADLEEYPANEPTTIGFFYRLAVIDVVFRNIASANASWGLIQADVAALITGLNLLDNLDDDTDVVFGESSTPEESSLSE